ncbi:MAG: hypothetical protein NTY76_06275 [Candidatus Omnitrophica bacterium]|nr:hypothetical protein [Candidatus Omnitrophota bacterium]
MRRAIKSIFAAVLFLTLASSFSYCETISVDELVTRYVNATEVQRQQIESEYRYKTISVSGTIKDVIDWNTFDEKTDTAGHYYKVITESKTAKAGISYEISILYKDKAKVEPLSKGQEIKTDGTFIKIINEINLLSILVYTDELTPEDKVMFEL